MENISYEKFKKLLDSLSTFDEITLNALYEKYSKKVVNYYFDKMSGNLSEKEFINSTVAPKDFNFSICFDIKSLMKLVALLY